MLNVGSNAGTSPAKTMANVNVNMGSIPIAQTTTYVFQFSISLASSGSSFLCSIQTCCNSIPSLGKDISGCYSWPDSCWRSRGCWYPSCWWGNNNNYSDNNYDYNRYLSCLIYNCEGKVSLSRHALIYQ